MGWTQDTQTYGLFLLSAKPAMTLLLQRARLVSRFLSAGATTLKELLDLPGLIWTSHDRVNSSGGGGYVLCPSASGIGLYRIPGLFKP